MVWRESTVSWQLTNTPISSQTTVNQKPVNNQRIVRQGSRPPTAVSDSISETTSTTWNGLHMHIYIELTILKTCVAHIKQRSALSKCWSPTALLQTHAYMLRKLPRSMYSFLFTLPRSLVLKVQKRWRTGLTRCLNSRVCVGLKHPRIRTHWPDQMHSHKTCPVLLSRTWPKLTRDNASLPASLSATHSYGLKRAEIRFAKCAFPGAGKEVCKKPPKIVFPKCMPPWSKIGGKTAMAIQRSNCPLEMQASRIKDRSKNVHDDTAVKLTSRYASLPHHRQGVERA
jgi:hypothetical protein